MSLLNDASIVVVPSGYKAGKVYSVKPTDGSGDLSFTRSLDTATRVGPDGLIEKVRTNLALHSEDFTNAYYTKIFATVTANTIANPVNGAITADTITPTADNDVHRLRLSPTGLSAIVHTFSIFVKANGYNFVRVIENTTTGNAITFNLLNGTIVSGSLGGQIVALGNGFFRCSTQMVVAASQNIDVQIQETSDTQTFVGNGTSGIFAFGAQLETGDIATTYIETTTAAVSVGMLANVPRLDYEGGGCPRLLLEPQRTNLALFSEQLNNAAYNNKAQVTITPNFGISPDGFQNADRLLSTGSTWFFAQNHSLTAASHTISVFVKSNTSSNQTFRILANTSITSANFTATTEFQRFTFTFTATSGSLAQGIVRDTSNNAADLLVYGFQLELGSFATSYIPTLGAAVTRSADAASKTGISALIGQTEGTLFAEFVLTNLVGDRTIFEIGADNNNRIRLRINGSNISANVVIDGTVVATITFTSQPLGIYKLAYGYKQNDFQAYLNGNAGTPVLSANVPTSMSILGLGTRIVIADFFNDNINQALLFPTRLTDTQLEELTTL